MIPSEVEIMRNWRDADVPMVSIKCFVYNHENYVSQALDGFLMQKTTFPFEVIIHDDASTDSSARIIKEYEAKYPHIIKPIYETENQYSKHDGSLSRAIDPLLKGKYIALCEGDDYWIDENKLQMQVDFLEENLEYGLCYTRTRQFIQKSNRFSRVQFGGHVKDFKDLLLNGNRIPTLTTMFRKILLDNYLKEIHPQDKGWLMGDYPMWLYFVHESKVKFLNTVSSVYRVLENSASHSVDMKKSISFAKSTWEIQNFFSKKYMNQETSVFDEHLWRAYFYLNSNNRKNAKKEFVLCKEQTIKVRIYEIVCSFELLFVLFRFKLWVINMRLF